MWELDHKESWALKKGCFWSVVLEKTLESPLGSKEIQPVNTKGNQFWIFIGRTDAEAETLILWPPDAKNWVIGKDPDAGKDWRQEEKGARGWDGWMASPTQWTWVWVGSGNWWWTGKPGVLHSMVLKSQTERLNWTKWNSIIKVTLVCNIMPGEPSPVVPVKWVLPDKMGGMIWKVTSIEVQKGGHLKPGRNEDL